MKFFTFDHSDNAIAITGYPDEEDEATLPPAAEGFVRVIVDNTLEAVTKLDNLLLLTAYNHLKQGGPVKKIKSHSVGAAQVHALLNNQPDPETATQPANAETETAPGDDAAPANEESPEMSTNGKTKKTKAPKAAKPPPKKTKAPKDAKPPPKEKKVKGPRGEKIKAIAHLLGRKNGCTSLEVREMTGWPSVSMPAMAKACGMKLRKEKVEKSGDKRAYTRYYGTPL